MWADFGVAGALVIAGWVILPWLVRVRQPARLASPPADLSLAPAALVNYVLAKCEPGAVAYQAAILDLAAQGQLTVGATGGGLWVAAPTRPADPPGLVWEQQVIQDVRARLAGTDGSPLQAVAQASTADVRGVWQPFEHKLRDYARDCGISRPLIPSNGWSALVALTATVLIGVVVYLVAVSRPHVHTAPSVAAAAAVIVFWVGLGWMGKQERLTRAGARLAAQWRHAGRAGAAPGGAMPLSASGNGGGPAAAWGTLSPPELHTMAITLASGGTASGAGYDGGPRDRKGRAQMAKRPAETDRPSEVWSSFTGQWRLVKIRSDPGWGMGAGIVALACAAWAAIIGYAVSLAGGTGPLPLVFWAGAVLLVLGGVRHIARTSAIPSSRTFDGQVIARWHEDSDTETSSGTHPFSAVDDGERAWTFPGYEVYNRVALGDLVRVTLNPRSGKLRELTVVEHLRMGQPGAGPVGQPPYQ